MRVRELYKTAFIKYHQMLRHKIVLPYETASKTLTWSHEDRKLYSVFVIHKQHELFMAPRLKGTLTQTRFNPLLTVTSFLFV